MSKFEIHSLAQGLADQLDQRAGQRQFSFLNPSAISRSFGRRKIMLTDRGEVSLAEVQAALRALGTCLPDKAAAWLSGRLLKIDSLDTLADALWQLSLASVPVDKRKLGFYAQDSSYQALLATLYEAFLWYLLNPKIGGQITDQQTVYRRLIYSYYNRVADCFRSVPSQDTPVDALINRAIEGFFKHDVGPEAVADPAMEILMKELLPQELAERPAVQDLAREVREEFRSELADLRSQLAKLSGDMQRVLKGIGKKFGDPVVSRDRWTAVNNSPEHEVELGWLLSQVPEEAHEALLHEIALAVSQEQKMPSIERFRQILSDILKKQKRLIC